MRIEMSGEFTYEPELYGAGNEARPWVDIPHVPDASSPSVLANHSRLELASLQLHWQACFPSQVPTDLQIRQIATYITRQILSATDL